MSGSEHRPINVIAASAGTGKTYRLSEEYIKGLSLAGQTPGGPAIAATTFTNKAADELIERVRTHLLTKGDWLGAQDVLSGYLGTVNSICGRILSEQAIAAGLSPDLTVISEERLPVIFATAVDNVIYDFAEEMNEAAARLRIENIRAEVQSVIDMARNNNLSPDKLDEFAESSWERLRALLPQAGAEQTADFFDARLAFAITEAQNLLKDSQDNHQKTQEVRETLNDANRRLKAYQTLPWQLWAKLSKLEVNKESRAIIIPVLEAAKTHAQHPRLHDDIKTVIFSVFRCAKAAMEEYEKYKRQRGLIDFVDQEHLVLQLLKQPRIAELIKEKVHLLLVDEFQDTSPIQLAVFLELARLVDYTVWVGDEKQSIFGFRGSDPELMQQAVAQLVPKTGGRVDHLAKSYRSRPSLVEFTNEVFSRVGRLMKIIPENAIIKDKDRIELAGQRQALHFWWLQGHRQDQTLSSLSFAVRQMLEDAYQWPVVDRKTGLLRDILGSDIAILCRSNRSRMAVAKALVEQGLTVATERDSLLDTPECALTIAALRFLVDDSDTLAIAEINNLVSDSQEGKWLDDWLTSGRQEVEKNTPVLSVLKQVRDKLIDRTPCQVLELAIAHSGVLNAALGWGDVRQRLSNLDSLRGLARTYEAVCASGRTPATASGLIVFFHKNLADGGHQPANPDENGIHLVTYHKSKGLEWPMVLLFDLDWAPSGSAFGITVEFDQGNIDAMKPLDGRSLRYWPWPYGAQRANLELGMAVARTREGKAAAAQNTAESLRLLYVGMTRARDYLIFACRQTFGGTNWLDLLRDADNEKIFVLSGSTDDGDEELIPEVHASRARCTVKRLPDARDRLQKRRPSIFGHSLDQSSTAATALGQPLFPSFYLNPSSANQDDFRVRQWSQQTHILGERLTLSGAPDMQVLGDCVHAFFAADLGEPESSDRLAIAARVLANWSVENLTASDLVVMSDRLRSFFTGLYPSAIWNAEVPISGRLGMRRVQGTIDLLLEVPAGFVIIDHKTFPGRFDEWHKRALQSSPQLALYSHLVEQVTGRKVVATFIHMPVVGAAIALESKLAELSNSS